MAAKRTCIGFDIGRSAVKIVAVHGKGERTEITYPSAFSAAVRITDDREAARAAAETVSIDGKEYFVGETAVLQGRDDLIGGLSDDWTFSVQHSALFLSGMKKLHAAGIPNVDAAVVVAGLPARLYAHQKAQYGASLSKLATRAEVKVVPQSLGPYYTMMLSRDGSQDPKFNSDDDSWGIIEVGQYTTDFALVEGGRTVENAFGSCEGMRVAAEALIKIVLERHNLNITLSDATDALAVPKMKNFGKIIDLEEEVALAVAPLSQTIHQKAQQLFGDRIRKMDGIRLAGGGAPLVSTALAKAWPTTSVADNSRFAVAEGFCRFALGLELYRNSTAEA